jgi:hypothetical protein
MDMSDVWMQYSDDLWSKEKEEYLHVFVEDE